MDPPPSLESILATVPEPLKFKLDQKLDHGHGDVPIHLGYIAKRTAEWEGRVADHLDLNCVEVRDIKYGPNRDQPEMQRSVLGCSCIYYRGCLMGTG